MQIGSVTHYHHGFASERNPRLLRLPGGQFTSLSILTAVHSRECKCLIGWPRSEICNSNFHLEFHHSQIPDYRNSVIVARNPGSAKKATSYAERLRLGIAVIHGEQKESESDEIDGRYSPPPSLPRYDFVACKRFNFCRNHNKQFSHYFVSPVVHERWTYRLVFQCIRPKRSHR